MMVREVIYERMVNEMGSRTPFGKRNTLRELYEKAINDYIKRLEYLEKELEFHKKYKEDYCDYEECKG